MNDFKVGDKVRIREWGDMEKEFGTNSYGSIKCYGSFSIAMKHLCGRTATITTVGSNRVELEDWSDMPDINWNYSTDMIEKVEEEVDMNKMAEVAKLFGVELNEEFDIEGSGFNPHKFTLKGIVDCDGGDKRHVDM